MIPFAHHGGWIVFLTFIIALMLMMVPLPTWASPFRPEWVAMVLIYWCLAIPQRMGVGFGWTTGFVLDVVDGTLLGLHAMGMAAIAYLALKLYQRIRMFPVWQQSLSILILVALNQLLILWVKGITGQPPGSWAYWLPAVTSMLLWPWLFVILRDLRRRFKIA